MLEQISAGINFQIERLKLKALSKLGFRDTANELRIGTPYFLGLHRIGHDPGNDRMPTIDTTTIFYPLIKGVGSITVDGIKYVLSGSIDNGEINITQQANTEIYSIPINDLLASHSLSSPLTQGGYGLIDSEGNLYIPYMNGKPNQYYINQLSNSLHLLGIEGKESIRAFESQLFDTRGDTSRRAA